MLKYVIKRILLMFLTLIVIVAIYFILVRLLPRELPMDKSQKEAIEARFEVLGYNKPILIDLI